RSAVSERVPRSSSSCARPSGLRSAPDTIAPVRCPFGTVKSARRVGAGRVALGHSPPWLALLSSPLAALVRRAREADIARHGPSVSKFPGEHLLNQHVRRLDADANDAGQKAHHRM